MQSTTPRSRPAKAGRKIANTWKSGISGKIVVAIGGLIGTCLVCTVCSIPLSFFQDSTPTPLAKAPALAELSDQPTPALLRTVVSEPVESSLAKTSITPPVLPTDTPQPVLPTPRATDTPPPATPTSPPTRVVSPPTTIPNNNLSLPAGLTPGEVFAIVDGDTVDITVGDQVVRLRLIGIDTPETKDPNEPVQCFGPEATNRARELLTGQAVLLEADPTQGEYDRYDRLLRYLWLADGRLYNHQMVVEGYATEYTYDKPYKYQQLFRQAEQEAQAQLAGLWSPNTCNGNTSTPTSVKSPPIVVLPGGGTTGTMTIDDIQFAGGDEYIVITNRSSAAQTLDGWSIQSYGGKTCRPVAEQIFYFPAGYTLEAGASVRVHSGPQASSAPPGDLFWQANQAWNNNGDRADLRVPDGTIVLYAYGSCR